MVQSQFSLNWESFKSSVCEGFSALQQNGELVDMTLAADGHFVKVHQVLMALVSPYLKELITSAPCQHPVIFLNNVPHNILSLLLQYVYTGEVVVPYDELNTFTETARALHIRGLENLSTEDNMSVSVKATWAATEGSSSRSAVKRPAQSRITEQVETPRKKLAIKRQRTSLQSSMNQQELDEPQNDNVDYMPLEDTLDQDTDNDAAADHGHSQPTTDDKKDSNSQVQFSVSIRGSLQVILNRYIYNLHSVQHRSGVRRWRCVDYRNSRCPAYVITNGNLVLSRANPHNHTFHDKKILQKIEKKSVFTALDDVLGYKEELKEADKSFGIGLDDTDTGTKKEVMIE